LVAQNAQLEQYAFITAHNLKAPVARLKGLTNIFEITNARPNPNEEIVRRIKEASLDMDEVISDINKILQIKNFNQQDKNKIDLPDLIKKLKNRLESKSTQNNVRIETNLQVKSILSIDTYLESILYNLIYNGIKYHRDDVDSVVEIQSYKKVKRTIIKVKDNGIGIDLDKYKSKLFGLYQRFHDHVNGKGIGLYLVKTQVEALNGKIYVTSNINEGTEFKLSFPTE
jgi:signal transduction histidine kinase